MPYLISELLPSLPKLVPANPEEPLVDALNRMLQFGYSQLPVVKGSGHSAQFYLVTHHKILEKLKYFGLPLTNKALKVEHALVKVPRVFTAADTITEVMDGLKEMDAVLIVDDKHELKHVVTIYDTTHFFRRWSEDLLHVREVELALRKIIEGSFKFNDGTVDEQLRQKAIERALTDDAPLDGKAGYKRFAEALKTYLGQQHAEGRGSLDRRNAFVAFKVLLEPGRPQEPAVPLVVGVDNVSLVSQQSGGSPPSGGTPPPSSIALDVAARELRQRFEAALTRYLELTQAGPDVNDAWLAAAYRQHFQTKQEPKSFNKLTLGEYIDLFFREQCWGRCETAFDFDQDVVQGILQKVLNARNLLAHFREQEMTDEHRSTLRQTAELMPEYQRKALAKFAETAPEPPPQPQGLDALLGEAAQVGSGRPV